MSSLNTFRITNQANWQLGFSLIVWNFYRSATFSLSLWRRGTLLSVLPSREDWCEQAERAEIRVWYTCHSKYCRWSTSNPAANKNLCLHLSQRCQQRDRGNLDVTARRQQLLFSFFPLFFFTIWTPRLLFSTEMRRLTVREQDCRRRQEATLFDKR